MRSKNRRGADRGQRNQAHKRTKTKPMVQGIPGPTTSPVSSPGFPPSVQMDRPDASMRVGLVVVPEFAPTDMRSLTPRPPEGSIGIYTVKFVLSTPGRDSFLNSIDVADVMRSGDSLLQAPRPDISQVKLTISNGTAGLRSEVLFDVNSRRALSTATIRVQADSFIGAHMTAHDLVMPILSWWSYRYDIAIDVTACELFEELTDVRRWVVGVIGKTKVLDGAGYVSKPEYRTLFASYREGASASNPFYQLVCFYRVIEGVLKLRAARRESVQAVGGTYREPDGERISDKEEDLGIRDELLLSSFRPYLGKKYTWVRDQLRDSLRNAIAHLDPTGDSLVADNFADVTKCEEVVPVIRYISRMMLRNELKADPDTASSVP